MHLSTADLCRRLGECRDNHTPPVVYAADAVRALDEAGVAKGVILSGGYLYGLRGFGLPPAEVTRLTRLENEFTAAEVRKFPNRLVGFVSVDPLQPSALAELAHWRGDPVFQGVKLHLTASSVDLNRPDHRAQVAGVLAAAAAQQLGVVIHIGGGPGPAEADLFIAEVLPSAGSEWVQIAHGAGGLPLVGDNHVGILRVFADHVERGDPVTERVLFDLSFMPATGEDSATVRALVREMRRIGIERFMFGSDFPVETPIDAITRLRRLGLSAEEWAAVTRACAPWAC